MPSGHRFAAWNGQAAGNGRYAEPPELLFPLVSTKIKQFVAIREVFLSYFVYICLLHCYTFCMDNFFFIG